MYYPQTSIINKKLIKNRIDLTGKNLPGSEFLIIPHCGGKMKNLLSPKKNCQISSLVFSLVETLFSRNFCGRTVTVNFRNFHTPK